jgi:exopolysaccharide biosynthesis polyprenyl glycosylphosphotransferase
VSDLAADLAFEPLDALESLAQRPALSVAVPRRRRPSPARLGVLDACIAVAVTIAVAGDLPGAGTPHGGFAQALWVALVAASGPVAYALSGSYRLARLGAFRITTVLLGATLCVWLVALASALLGARLSVDGLGLEWVALALACGLSRGAAIQATAPERVLVVGGGKAAQRFVETSGRCLRTRTTIVGYVDDGPPAATGLELAWLGNLDDLAAVVAACGIERIVVAFTPRSDKQMLELIRGCDRLGVRVDIMPRLFDFVGSRPEVTSVGFLPMISVVPSTRSPLVERVKRGLEPLAALILLAVLAPVFVVVAVAIKLDDGERVFFRQTRVGVGGKPFRIFKFRTMVCDRDRAALAEARGLVGETGGVDVAVLALKTHLAPPVTRVGRLLRRTSLDELPQLLNVLLGQMSLIGPRPLRQFETDSLVGWQRSRLAVRPGMTGPWQVAGRSEVGWDERLELDYAYVRHASLRGDAEIVARTLPAVVRGNGAL